MKTISLKFRLPLFVAVVCCLSVPVRATAAVMAGTGAGICSEFVTGGVKKTNPVLRAGKVLCVPTGCGASTLKIPRRSMSPRRGCRGSFVPTARSMVSARAAGRCRSPRRRSCCVGAVPTVGTAAAWGVIRCGALRRETAPQQGCLLVARARLGCRRTPLGMECPRPLAHGAAR